MRRAPLLRRIMHGIAHGRAVPSSLQLRSGDQKTLLHTFSKIKLPKLSRMPELDALRGLFLVWMALTHLPTRFSELVNQPFGFVSSAEGFVFLSALLVARLYIRQAMVDGQGLRVKLWRRALKIYGYHVILLALAFTVAARLAVVTHRTALLNLLDFYFAHPAVAVLGSLLLIYCPPLLDILPLYVIFLAATPLLLSAALRYGWSRVITGSLIIWALAQFGLRSFINSSLVHLTHLPIPLQEAGAFNLFSWQWVWIAGLWIGAKSAEGPLPLRRIPGWVTALCAVICAFFIGVRHGWLGPHLTVQVLGMYLDKWNIGALRMVNLLALAVVFYWLRKPVLRLVAVEPFLTLGKASLEVFFAHIIFVFIGLALLYGEVTELEGYPAALLVTVTLSGMTLVAVREVRRQKEKLHAKPKAPQNMPPPAASIKQFAE